MAPEQSWRFVPDNKGRRCLVSRQSEQWTADLTIKKVPHSLPETKEKQTKVEGPATVGCQGGSGSVS